jgi:hypothetical protein
MEFSSFISKMAYRMDKWITIDANCKVPVSIEREPQILSKVTAIIATFYTLICQSGSIMEA